MSLRRESSTCSTTSRTGPTGPTSPTSSPTWEEDRLLTVLRAGLERQTSSTERPNLQGATETERHGFVTTTFYDTSDVDRFVRSAFERLDWSTTYASTKYASIKIEYDGASATAVGPSLDITMDKDDASGRLKVVFTGSGVSTMRGYDEYAGRLKLYFDDLSGVASTAERIVRQERRQDSLPIRMRFRVRMMSAADFARQ